MHVVCTVSMYVHTLSSSLHKYIHTYVHIYVHCTCDNHTSPTSPVLPVPPSLGQWPPAALSVAELPGALPPLHRPPAGPPPSHAHTLSSSAPLAAETALQSDVPSTQAETTHTHQLRYECIMRTGTTSNILYNRLLTLSLPASVRSSSVQAAHWCWYRDSFSTVLVGTYVCMHYISINIHDPKCSENFAKDLFHCDEIMH